MDVTLFIILLGIYMYQMVKDDLKNELDNDLWERMY